MSILGYSTSYFLPEYWSGTPLYGEKIISLLDNALSLNYSKSESLAEVFYTIVNKYKNTSDLSISVLEELITESGYSYIRDLIGDDHLTLILLVQLLPTIKQYKGTKSGLELVLSLLRKNSSNLKYRVIGNPMTFRGTLSNFSSNDYAYFKGLRLDNFSFEILTKFTTGSIGASQCLLSTGEYGFSLSISSQGNLILSLGNSGTYWNIVDGAISTDTLSENTTYFVRFRFDGFRYTINISEDNVVFKEVIAVESNETLNIHSGKMYLGVNGTSKSITSPFLGSISRDGTFIAINDMSTIEWFEQLPVGEENTFGVKANIDLDIISSDFFDNFFTFASKYVYPTLTFFEASLTYESDIVITGYTRQKITFVSSGSYGMTTPFMVKEPEMEDKWEDFMVSLGSHGEEEIFDVISKEEND